MQKPQVPDLQFRRLLALSVLVSSVLPGGVPVGWSGPRASSSGTEQIVRQIESSYREVRSLRAAFTQTYTWGARKRVESGTVYFARGGLMRWEYSAPTEKLFLADGKNLYLYVPAEKQLTRSKLKSSGDIRVPFLLMLSRLSLRKMFSKIEIADREPKRDSGDLALRAFPKRDQEEDYQEVLIELDPRLDIRRLVVLLNDHSTMEFAFDHIERNVPLGSRLFHFTPLPGTEVIEQP